MAVETVPTAEPRHTIAPQRLAYQLNRRGMSWQSLLKENGGPFNKNTVTKLRDGVGTLALETFMQLRDFLKSRPIDPLLDSLMEPPTTRPQPVDPADGCAGSTTQTPEL